MKNNDTKNNPKNNVESGKKFFRLRYVKNTVVLLYWMMEKNIKRQKSIYHFLKN